MEVFTKPPKSLSELQDSTKYINLTNESYEFRYSLINKYVFVWITFDRIVKCVKVHSISMDSISFTFTCKTSSGATLYKNQSINININGGPFFIPIESRENVLIIEERYRLSFEKMKKERIEAIERRERNRGYEPELIRKIKLVPGQVGYKR